MKRYPVADHRPDVELRIPADSAFLSVLRTATAGLAARLDFTLDDIEDLRIAVDEACAMVLPQALAGSDLNCAFFLDRDTLRVAVAAECEKPRPPSQDGFAWTVLSALTTSLDAQVEGDTLTVTLSRTSGDPA
jgi:serine/threonine-protein kinase RsbW